MLLVLHILSNHKAPEVSLPPVQFSVTGGTIGRSPGNELVLDDPGKYISRVHARIMFRDGSFYLADVGSNPSVVNDRPLGNGREVRLVEGDQISIGDYLLKTQILAPASTGSIDTGLPPPATDATSLAAQAPPLPLFEPPAVKPAALPAFDLFAPAPPKPAPAILPRDPLAAASILNNDAPQKGFGSHADPLGLNLFGSHPGAGDNGFGSGAGDSPGLAFRGSASDHVAPENYALPSAPAVTWRAGAIPDDYDPMSDLLQKALPASDLTSVPYAKPAASSAVPSVPGEGNANPFTGNGGRPSAAASPQYAKPAPPDIPAQVSSFSAGAPSVSAAGNTLSGDATLEALLRGLELPNLQTKFTGPELAELVGAMLREATGGAMQTLMARSLTKRESRLDMTMIASQANNPLKFFPDADSALSQMLSQAASGYMRPVKAFGNAFADLQAHELAVMAGMRAALAAVLRRFDPAAIEERLDVPTVMDKMLASSRKAKMWDRLVVLYAEISREADSDFQRLFGESFAAAYEEQVERMRSRGK